MLQVRWNLKPTTTRDKKTLAASFNPLFERFKAHRDFDMYAKEVPASHKRGCGASADSKESGAEEEEKKKTSKQQKKGKSFELSQNSTSDSSDTERGENFASSDTASNHDQDIGILEFDGCDDLDYDIDLQACFPLAECGLALPSPPPSKESPSTLFMQPSFAPHSGGSRMSVPKLRELEEIYDLTDSGVLVCSEQDVMSLGQDDAREIARWADLILHE